MLHVRALVPFETGIEAAVPPTPVHDGSAPYVGDHSTLASDASGAKCAMLLRAYHNYTVGARCPDDRHTIEELFFDEACLKPGPRLCYTTPPTMFKSGGPIDFRMDSNVKWLDFAPLRSWRDAMQASGAGRVDGVASPPGGTAWGFRAWDTRERAAAQAHVVIYVFALCNVCSYVVVYTYSWSHDVKSVDCFAGSSRP